MMIGILGASGLIGHNLHRFLSGKNEKVLGSYFSKKKEGLERFDLLTDKFNLFDKCDQVVIAAAVTNIDDCFLNKEEAYKFNVEKTVEFIRYLNKRRIKAIFISSDQVFDGNIGNYKEDDAPNPVNNYGRFKLQVEEFLKKNSDNFLILRLSKTYSRSLEEASMFAEIFHKLKRGEKVKAAFNQIYNPTDVKIICDGVYASIRKGLKGLYHLADKKVMSRYDFAQSIATEYGFDRNLVERIDFCSLPVIERRALNSSLNVDKFMKASDLSQA